MSTLKADAVTSAQDNTDLTLSGTGTGGVKVNDFFVQTKGADIASGTTLTLGKDGNQFDVTGTTTITGIATQGIGSYVTLHFDGILTFTHHSTNLILPGAANITTAAGDIAVMYEYASADWRCVSYTKASGLSVVAGGGGFAFVENQTASTDATITFSHTVAANYDYMIICRTVNNDADIGAAGAIGVQVGTGGTPTFQTSSYTNQYIEASSTTRISARDHITSRLAMAANAGEGGAGGATETWDAHCLILNPGAAEATTMFSEMAADDSAGALNFQKNMSRWNTTTAVTGLRVVTSEDNFETGEFDLYRRGIA
jgi:hypothetical protein